MVRVNIIEPSRLSDQHLIAEYNEILMLVAYIKSRPNVDDTTPSYRLGPGHMKFFKDKVLYLKKRHELLKEEMRKRGFRPTKEIDMSEFEEPNMNDWAPEEKDFEIISARIEEKLRLKPEYYRYYGENRDVDFLVELVTGHS